VLCQPEVDGSMPRVVAQMVAHRDHRSLRPRALQDPLAFGLRERERLLDEHVEAAIDALLGLRRVLSVGRREDHSVARVRRQELIEARVGARVLGRA
jgi:hypothetical protein